jgi:hypothetical protein
VERRLVSVLFADLGDVLVGESTRRATESAIAYADAGVHEFGICAQADGRLSGGAARSAKRRRLTGMANLIAKIRKWLRIGNGKKP